jgi:hypothetical protein
MRDRIEQQELMVADWQIALSTKLRKLQQEKYPDFTLHTVGKAYANRQYALQL